MGKVRKRSIKKIILILLISVIALFIIASAVLVPVLMGKNFTRGEYGKYTVSYRYNDYKNKYSRTPVSFKSGKNTLQGYIYGEENDKGLIVVSHGIGGGHEGYIQEIIWFVDHGWRVFAYDCTGSCESEGDGTRGLPQSALDLDSALTYIENDDSLSKLKKCLFGHSWGGYAVTAVLNFEHEASASASIAGYAEPMQMILEFAEGMMGKFAYAEYPFIWCYNKFLFGENASLSAIDGINKSDIPVMIIHGEDDQMIGYNRSSIISKKDEITNPNVEYYTISGKYSGHNSIFQSEEVNEYLEGLNKELENLLENYPDDNVPDDVLNKFYEKADRAKANGINEEMMNRINNFFEESLKK